jgi:hypothetical protein
MQDDAEIPLILGRTFLSDAKARVNMGNGTIRFRIGKKNLMFRFRGNDEQFGEWIEP